MRPVETVDLRALLAAMSMAALAGATDVYGLARLRDTFVSFMSGNTTMMAFAAGKADWGRAGLIGGIIALFLTGAIVGAAVRVRAEHRHAVAVMAIVAALLAVPLLHDPLTVPCLALAMGALNTTVARVGDTAISLTFVTGALVKIGSGLGRWLVGVKEQRDWLLHAPIWLALCAGAVCSALLQARFGLSYYFLLPLFAALLMPFLALASL